MVMSFLWQDSGSYPSRAADHVQWHESLDLRAYVQN